MSFIGGLRDRLHRLTAPERRYAGPFGTFGAGPIATGVGLAGGRMAENLSVVTSCVELISGTLATAPATVYRAVDRGRVEAPEHPVSALIRRPCPRLSWPDWLSMTMADCLLFGNALSIIERGEDGEPTALIPIPWKNVNVQLLPNGKLAFDVMVTALPWGGTGSPQRFLDGEIFLLRARSDDGYLGRSVLSRAPSVLAAAIGSQTFATAIYEQGVNPAGSLKHPGKLSPDGRAFLNEEMSFKHAGAGNVRKVLLLDEGMSFDPFDVKSESQELLGSRRFSGEEIARLFNVPPSLIGEFQFGSFSNVETAGRFFSQFCLAVWARRLEAEFQRSVFLPDDVGHHLQLDLASLERGDAAARWASYAIAIDKGILSTDEIREVEGWNPRGNPGPEVVP